MSLSKEMSLNCLEFNSAKTVDTASGATHFLSGLED